MRLLLRANSHRALGTGAAVEVAAAPDTPGRERWQWQVRVLPEGGSSADLHPAATRVSAALGRGDGSYAVVEVRCDPEIAGGAVDVLEPADAVRLDRDPREVTVLVVGRGRARVEGRHLLEEMDALVLAGDDPLAVELSPLSDSPSVAVVRVNATGTRGIGWVP